MGLACSQIRLLTLTSRKADVEKTLLIDSMNKTALTREQSDLTKEYNAKLQSKKIAYYADGLYNMIDYNYLMGTKINDTELSVDYQAILQKFYKSSSFDLDYGMSNNRIKSDPATILTDYTGRVVLSSAFASSIINVVGDNILQDAKGKPFNINNEVLAKILDQFAGTCTGISDPEITVPMIKAVLDGEDISSEFLAYGVNTLTGVVTGTEKNVDVADVVKTKIQAIIDFYSPIIKAAAANGWTTAYNNDIAKNSNYISDALISGTFQLAKVNEFGSYGEDLSLSYFLTSQELQARTDTELRESIVAWYEEMKNVIAEKEDYIDMEMNDLNTELSSIQAEMDSVKSFVSNAIGAVFDWGSS